MEIRDLNMKKEPAFPTVITELISSELVTIKDEKGNDTQVPNNHYETKTYPGVSKRFFAACPIAAELSPLPFTNSFDKDKDEDILIKCKKIVSISYIIADELLKQENL